MPALKYWDGAAWQTLFGSPPSYSYTATIGDGSTTVFTVTHNLNAPEVLCTVRESGGNLSYVFPEIQKIDANSLRLIFDVAPASGAYTVFVAGGAFVSSAAPSGSAGGDLSGSYPNPTVSKILGVPAPTLVSSLPGSPVDGQEVYYDVGGGVVWHLRYRAASASAYKWEMIGGPPMGANVPAQSAGVSVGPAWQSPYAGDVNLDLPLAGEYQLEWGGVLIVAGAGRQINLGIRVGATDPTVDGIRAVTQMAAAANYRNTLMGMHVETALITAAATHLQLRYANQSATESMIKQQVWISAMPRRVG